MTRRKRLVFQVMEVSKHKEIFRTSVEYRRTLERLLDSGKGPLKVEVKIYKVKG